jgi:hypothetical protein
VREGGGYRYPASGGLPEARFRETTEVTHTEAHNPTDGPSCAAKAISASPLTELDELGKERGDGLVGYRLNDVGDQSDDRFTDQHRDQRSGREHLCAIRVADSPKVTGAAAMSVAI